MPPFDYSEMFRPDDGSQLVDVSLIDADPDQPRKHFDPDDLDALAESISEVGVLLPIIVESIEGRYRIVSGERRWRASIKAGLTSLPVIIVDSVDRDLMQAAENIARSDLSAAEILSLLRKLLAPRPDGTVAKASRVRRALGMPKSTWYRYTAILGSAKAIEVLENGGSLRKAEVAVRNEHGGAEGVGHADEVAQGCKKVPRGTFSGDDGHGEVLEGGGLARVDALMIEIVDLLSKMPLHVKNRFMAELGRQLGCGQPAENSTEFIG